MRILVIFGKERNINMATKIKPELSEKNKYWISRHRYYELKHFCLQYPLWKKSYLIFEDYGLSKAPDITTAISKSNAHGDPTGKCAEAKAFYRDRIDMVERVARVTDPLLEKYILKAVTEGYSYDYLKTRLEMPSVRDNYYEMYRRFFWILDKVRG